MKTPEEMAAEVADKLNDYAVIPTGGCRFAAEVIAAAIREAVEEERERQAGIWREAVRSSESARTVAVQEETRRIMALAEYTRAVGWVKSKGSEDQLPFSAIMALSAAKA
jgi:hypothetical protein